MREFSRLLFTRGIHRYFGNPILGTVSGFLSVIFILRSAVNLYLIFTISTGKALMDYNQIILSWFISLSAYIITCSSLSAYHISFALPKNCFVELSPGGRDFRSFFLKQAFLIRPMNLSIVILAVIGEFIFFNTSTAYFPIFLGTGFLIIAVAAASVIFKLTSRLSIEMTDSQLLKTIFLAGLVLINPDVININNKVLILFNGVFIPMGNLIIALSALSTVLILTALLILIIKIFSSINVISIRKRSISPLNSWYWRFLKPRYWILLYLVYFLIQIPAFSDGFKLQASIILLIITTLSFFFFLNNIDNHLRENWRVSIFLKDNRKFLLAPLLVHILMICILPVIQIFSHIIMQN